MYDLKDAKDTDQFSRSLNGHVVRTNPFGRNASGDKAYRRAERLVAGLHLLTSHVSPEEPVRQIIRKKAVQLLSNILDLRDEMRGASSVKTRTVQASIRELISLVRILTISGFISFQNADVVIESLDELGNFLHASRRSSLSEDIILSREDLLGVQPVIQKKKAMTVTRTIGVLSDKEPETETISDIKDKMSAQSSGYNKTDAVTVRGQNILDVLGSGGELGIKDVCAHFPEYSEKMVQRELASLVSANKVRKIGLKRWSRYSLA
ncbi:MAG: hypothetical protein Q7S05_03975 [bacterium]|nr:hypothetical protein [bacterium]